MIADRLPQVAAHVVGAVTNEEVPTGCLGELKDAAAQLDRAGFVEHKYAELLQGDRCRLVVVGIETGGRWSTEALQFVEMLQQLGHGRHRVF